ncbi:hypothetical protein MUY14_19145 [Amycolatopsis sp. FBCC-B4732]|uniref:hypothetical protein n=1 Tax=Amycolatopsis sp. FBCC-B4732 TaxID=3079339 RepID=UPI001FF198F8|nr:hypothetical protein [Amycolatopsis sp. FBCC-B4732]UOX92632.1 hypothetical protein MUY14_19145 [Amycolatopsis sp. FBCC-B4732]
MTVWWGLLGLLGLLGCCGLLRGHRAREADPLARYPVAREPARPNADAAHTPLMTPVVTPEMLAPTPRNEPAGVLERVADPRGVGEGTAGRPTVMAQGAVDPQGVGAVAPERRNAEAAER